jgi:hypothetical protein
MLHTVFTVQNLACVSNVPGPVNKKLQENKANDIAYWLKQREKSIGHVVLTVCVNGTAWFH